MPALSDEDLVANVQRGIAVEESFRSLYTLYYSRVRRLFQRRGLALEESHELVQETFSRLFRSISSFKRGESFAPWLFGIANNVYLNEVRRKGSAKRAASEVRLEEALDTVDPTSRDPLDKLLDAERSDQLHTALAELPPQMRMCLLLRMRGHKYREIATLMKVSIDTVKAHLHQARFRLAQILRDQDSLTDLDSSPLREKMNIDLRALDLLKRRAVLQEADHLYIMSEKQDWRPVPIDPERYAALLIEPEVIQVRIEYKTLSDLIASLPQLLAEARSLVGRHPGPEQDDEPAPPGHQILLFRAFGTASTRTLRIVGALRKTLSSLLPRPSTASIKKGHGLTRFSSSAFGNCRGWSIKTSMESRRGSV